MKKFSNGEISAFCEDLAMLIDSGVPEEDAIIRMAEDSGSKLAEIIRYKYDLSLSKAVAESMAFPEYMVSMIEVGEATGRVGTVLIKLSEYYDRQEENENRISSLIIYPSTLMFILSGVLLFIAIKIFPVFRDVYQSLGGVISGSSEGLITFATIISWGLFVICLTMGAASVIIYKKWEKSLDKQKTAGTFSRFSYVGKIIYEIELAKFTTAFSSYYSSGIDVETAMTYGLKLVYDKNLSGKIARCIARIQNGADIATAFKEEGIYASSNNRTLFSSFTAGKLSEGLESMANEEWRLVDENLQDVTDTIEPAITLGLSVIVGILLISIMIPLIGIMTAIA